MVNNHIFLLTLILAVLILPASAATDALSGSENNDDSSFGENWSLSGAENISGFNVTFSPDERIITSRLDREPKFTVNVSEKSDIFWYLDDELINTYNDLNNSSYTPDLSETGNYSIKVNVSNVNGSAWNQWYWVATATPSQVMSGGSSGGSGGSSVSVTSGEDYENIVLKDVQMKVVNKGKTTSYTFSDASNPVDSIEFVSSVNAGYVKTTVELLKNRSSSVSKNPDDTVYSYSNIVLSNLALENKLSDTRIVFHVDKDWINENDIEVDSIRLNVFGQSNWKTFPVMIINENDHNITFVSTTTVFGSFAITGKGSEPQDEDVIVIDMGGNVVATSSSDEGTGSAGSTGISQDKEEDVLTSVLRSMTELFIKRNPVST